MHELSIAANMTLEEMMNDPDHVINAIDPEYRIIFWNKKSEELWQLCKNEVLGKRLEEVMPFVRGDERMQNLKRALQGKAVHILKEKYRYRKKGYYEQKLLPVKNADGDVIAVLNIVRDL